MADNAVREANLRNVGYATQGDDCNVIGVLACGQVGSRATENRSFNNCFNQTIVLDEENFQGVVVATGDVTSCVNSASTQSVTFAQVQRIFRAEIDREIVGVNDFGWEEEHVSFSVSAGTRGCRSQSEAVINSCLSTISCFGQSVVSVVKRVILSYKRVNRLGSVQLSGVGGQFVVSGFPRIASGDGSYIIVAIKVLQCGNGLKLSS